MTLFLLRLMIALLFCPSFETRDNWAVLLCTSRYFFNYRHLVNTLAVYHTIKKSGFSDDRIIFMNAEDDVICDNRNPLIGILKSNIGKDFFRNFSEYIEIDYKGKEVSIDNFLSVLLGRQTSDTPISKRLRSGPDSNIFIYMTGHGGDEFFKFQDSEELGAPELAYAIEEMYNKVRYREMLVVLDTCQASTMCKYIRSPSVYCIGSSQKGENSYAYVQDEEVGIPVMDRFTYAFVELLQKQQSKNHLSDMSIEQLISSMDSRFIRSKPTISSSTLSDDPHSVQISDFVSVKYHHVNTKIISERLRENSSNVVINVKLIGETVEPQETEPSDESAYTVTRLKSELQDDIELSIDDLRGEPILYRDL